MSETFLPAETTRREVLVKALYVTPVILTLTAVPSFASAGSGVDQGSDVVRPRGDNNPFGN
jgi:hypothetical protein